MTRIASALLSAAVCALVAASAAAADRYPSARSASSSGFAPGGGDDISARILADALARDWPDDARGQPPRRGRAPRHRVAGLWSSPDGYTLGLGGIGMAFSGRSTATCLRYAARLRPDFALDGSAQHPGRPPVAAREVVQGIVALARAQPGKLTYRLRLGTGTTSRRSCWPMSQKHEPPARAGQRNGPAVNGRSATRSPCISRRSPRRSRTSRRSACARTGNQQEARPDAPRRADGRRSGRARTTNTPPGTGCWRRPACRADRRAPQHDDAPRCERPNPAALPVAQGLDPTLPPRRLRGALQVGNREVDQGRARREDRAAIAA